MHGIAWRDHEVGRSRRSHWRASERLYGRSGHLCKAGVPRMNADLISAITHLAATSSLARHSWPGRGTAPLGYVKGMAVAFASTCQKLKDKDSAALVMASAVHESIANDRIDALSWYNSNFHKLGMNNDTAGIDTLRHLFALLIGLGMRESSGRYCEGRDRSASNTTADTAEAGLFQMSFNAFSASPELPKLFAIHSIADDSEIDDGLYSIFREGVMATDAELVNFGHGDGAAFQRLCKRRPLFAVECAAVGLRVVRKHWGPINRKEAEIRPEADELLRAAQALVVPAPTSLPLDPVDAPVGSSIWSLVMQSWPHEATAGALDLFYGNPRGGRGIVSASWLSDSLVKVVPPWHMTFEGKPITAITIHRKCAQSLTRVLAAIFEHYGHDQSRIDAVHLDEFDGSFAYRQNRNNAAKLSLHAYAAALDLAADWNPNGKSWRPNAGMMPIAVVNIFAAEGWVWGGQFAGTKDCMHFQATFNPHASEALPHE